MARKKPKPRPNTREPKINRRIRAYQVRVIDSDGAQLGVMDTRDALAKAQAQELDLVEVNGREDPPVCKIMDYGRHKYEQSKKERESRRNRVPQETKELKFGPKIGQHDLEFKVKHAREFLEEGHKVRMLVRFRGREIVHPETGRAVLARVCEALGDVHVVLAEPQMEQRQMTMVVGPSPRAKARAAAAAKEGAS